MKTILLAMVAWALTAAVSYGQLYGSGDAADTTRRFLDRVNEGHQEREQRGQEYKKAIETGRSLFGADERWEKWHNFSSPKFGKVV